MKNMNNGIITVYERCDDRFIYGFNMFPEKPSPDADSWKATYFHVCFMQPITEKISFEPHMIAAFGSSNPTVIAQDTEISYFLEPISDMPKNRASSKFAIDEVAAWSGVYNVRKE